MDNPAQTTEEREQFEALTNDQILKMVNAEFGSEKFHFGFARYLRFARAVEEAARRTAPDVRAIRAAALEEAANLADEMILYAGCDIANVLRALAAKKDET